MPLGFTSCFWRNSLKAHPLLAFFRYVPPSTWVISLSDPCWRRRLPSERGQSCRALLFARTWSDTAQSELVSSVLCFPPALLRLPSASLAMAHGKLLWIYCMLFCCLISVNSSLISSCNTGHLSYLDSRLSPGWHSNAGIAPQSTHPQPYLPCILLRPRFFEILSFSVTSICCSVSAQRCCSSRCPLWTWSRISATRNLLFGVTIISYLHWNGSLFSILFVFLLVSFWKGNLFLSLSTGAFELGIIPSLDPDQ